LPGDVQKVCACIWEQLSTVVAETDNCFWCLSATLKCFWNIQRSCVMASVLTKRERKHPPDRSRQWQSVLILPSS